MENSPLTNVAHIYRNFSGSDSKEKKDNITSYTPLTQKSRKISPFPSPYSPFEISPNNIPSSNAHISKAPLPCSICKGRIEKGAPINFCEDCGIAMHHNCALLRGGEIKNVNNYCCEKCGKELNMGIYSISDDEHSASLNNNSTQKVKSPENISDYYNKSIGKTSPTTYKIKHINNSNISVNSIKKGNLFSSEACDSEKDVLFYPESLENQNSFDTNINKVTNYETLVKLALGNKIKNIKSFIDDNSEFNIVDNNNDINSSNNNCNTNVTAYFGESDTNENINNISFGPNSQNKFIINNNNNNNNSNNNTENKYFSSNLTNNKVALSSNSSKRIPLSQIKIPSSPYLYHNNINNNNINNNNNNIEVNKKLFISESKIKKDNIDIDDNNEGKVLGDISGINISNDSLDNLLDQTINNSNKKNYMREADYDEINDENLYNFNISLNEYDNDNKENIPILPRENNINIDGNFLDNNNINNNENNNINTNDNNNNSFNDLYSGNNDLQVCLSAGLSHLLLPSSSPVFHVPLSLSLRPLSQPNFSTSFLLVFNTASLSLSSIRGVLGTIRDTMGQGDAVFSNVFRGERWAGKDEVSKMVGEGRDEEGDEGKGNFREYFKEYIKYGYKELSNVIKASIDSAISLTSHIYSVFIICDIDEADEDYKQEIEGIIEKMKISKVNLIKSFSLSVLLLDDGRIPRSPRTANFTSFLFDLSKTCLGLFFSVHDAKELKGAVSVYSRHVSQTSLLNLRLRIRGNRDPSLSIDVLGFPAKEGEHNCFEVFVGNMLKKEKKIINLSATIYLNNANINSFMLPLLEISCEFFVNKQIGNSTNFVVSKTDYVGLTLPILNRPDSPRVRYSYSIISRNLLSKIAQKIAKGISAFKALDFEGALAVFIGAKEYLDSFIRRKLPLKQILKMNLESKKNNNSFGNCSSISNINNVNSSCGNFSNISVSNNNDIYNNSINNNMMNNDENDLNNNSGNISCISNFDSSISRNIDQIAKSFKMVYSDLSYLIENTKSKNLSSLGRFFTIEESLSFHRSVVLSDERFIEDNYY